MARIVRETASRLLFNGGKGRVRMVKKYVILITLLVTSLGLSTQSFGQDFVEDPSSLDREASDATFDPFSDYSEFEEGTDEEADMNFFHHGRFFNVALLGGYEGFTGTYGELYAPAFAYGLAVSYFFNLRVALQVSYSLATHGLTMNYISGSSAVSRTGSVQISHLAFDLKYYINTQNISRGLKAINPYIIAGLSNHQRQIIINGTPGFVRNAAMGVEAGFGVEFPLARNQYFVGTQVTYNYIGWEDRGSPIYDTAGNATSPVQDGDAIIGLVTLGINF